MASMKCPTCKGWLICGEEDCPKCAAENDPAPREDTSDGASAAKASQLGRPAESLGKEDDDSLSFDPDLAWQKLGMNQVVLEAPIFTPPADLAESPGSPGGVGRLRLIAVSDTHGLHRGVAVPRGDILVHCGDFSNTGGAKGVRDFVAWLLEVKASKGFQHVVVIAGNHDTTFDQTYYNETGAKRFHPRRPEDAAAVKALLTACEGVTYLEDELAELHVRVGVGPAGEETFLPTVTTVFGSPWQPEFCDWAFNLDRGPPCREKWALIPSAEIDSGRRGVDVLLTHGPPLGRGDKCEPRGNRVGCVDLLRAVQRRVVPLLHLFGHIHEGAGEVSSDGATVFGNASTCTFHYQSLNPALVFDLVFDLVFEGHDGAASQHEGACLRPSRVEAVQSRVSDWSASQVGDWLEKEAAESCRAAEAAAAAAKAPPPPPKISAADALADQAAKHEDTGVQCPRTHGLPAEAAAVLEGLDGRGLSKLDPNKDERLACLDRNARASIIRAIRHLEAEHF